MHDVAPIVALVLGVVGVSALARAVRVPAPILLVGAGVVAALIPSVPDYHLEPELVLVVLLPPLLYAATAGTSLIDIKHEAKAIASLSVGLVIATTLGVGYILHAAVPSIPLAACFAFGAIVAPPDAVAAGAIARRAGLPRQALTVLEGESLFNDATALVALRVAVAAVAGEVTKLGAAGDLLVASIGGLAVGLVVGLALSALRRRVHDSLTDTAISLVAPFVAFLPAEEIEASGVIAVVVAGLLLAHRAPRDQDPRARLVEHSTWATVQFMLEGAVFALIGLQLPDLLRSPQTSARDLVVSLVCVLAAVILIRPAWIFATTYVARLNPWSGRERPSWRQMLVVSWAGIRGVVSLAAALSLPLDFPQRDLLLVLTVAVIVGTLCVQGLTLPWVVRRAGVPPPDPRLDQLELARAQQVAADAALARLDELSGQDGTPAPVVDRLRRLATLRTYIAWERLGDVGSGEPPTAAYRRLRREMIAAERSTFLALRDRGELDDELLRQVQLELDLEEALLTAAEGGDGDVEPRGMMEELAPVRAQACSHLSGAGTPAPAGSDGCEECLALGWSWVHLRICVSCGHVGCCDSSRGRHAAAHFHDAGHPVMQSAEPGERWRWCYLDSLLG